jgi:bifunctional DNA-binding transcriptional regulator/antitoxin component of YhaV-PrlF toxin-antitoxin module
MTQRNQRHGFSEEPHHFPGANEVIANVEPQKLKIGDGGRVVIPAEMRAAMMVKPGDVVTAEIVDGELRITSPMVALRRIQALARNYKKPGESVVDEFLADKYAEVAREDDEERAWQEAYADRVKGRK